MLRQFCSEGQWVSTGLGWPAVILILITTCEGLLVLHLLAIMPWCVQHKQPSLISIPAQWPLALYQLCLSAGVPAPLVTLGQSPQGSTHPSFMHLLSQDQLAPAALDQPCLEQPSQKSTGLTPCNCMVKRYTKDLGWQN